ncbi:DJ-1/PfpI family protein [Nocardiopsis composta]|uniref:Transcriptional regulator GlxA family with amidase domain n=1 Tax=Nocardiopsis composta TaxID=157465 RepID=A0A7W8VBI6_9ACTN|nr:DJ-1/PfpI family protein [Nocardiopsis composta]MBB5430361.1 transcriptional regulator GlxA family with amidase domain [Nocardiopsis composta]
MRIVIMLFDRFTGLDVVGPYEVLSRLPGAETVLVAERPGPVRTDTGALGLVADASLAEVGAADAVVVPGGPGQAALMGPGPVHEWLREVDSGSSWTVSVCTGSLVLAAAGLLRGRRATTHWAAMGQLAEHGVVPVRERVVEDGKYVSAAGVSAGIDMALGLAGRIEGDLFAQTVQLGIEYDPRPPYSAGSPDSAPPEVVAALLEGSRFGE